MKFVAPSSEGRGRPFWEIAVKTTRYRALCPFSPSHSHCNGHSCSSQIPAIPCGFCSHGSWSQTSPPSFHNPGLVLRHPRFLLNPHWWSSTTGCLSCPAQAGESQRRPRLPPSLLGGSALSPRPHQTWSQLRSLFSFSHNVWNKVMQSCC